MPPTEEGIFVSLDFSDHMHIGALDLSAFLFDVNRLYVVAFKVEQDPYEIDERGFRGYGRGSFRIPKAYQLNVSRIRFQSPGLIILRPAIAGIAAVWTLMQIVEKVQFWPLQWEKLRLEVEKLRAEEAARLASRRDPPMPVPPTTEYMTFDGTLEGHKTRPPGPPRRLRARGERQRIEPILTLPVVKSAVKQLSQNPLKPTDVTVDIAHEEPSHLYRSHVGERPV